MTDQVTEPTTTTSLDDLLSGIKRDDGTQKYKTAEEALKSIPDKEAHIKKLTEELAALREGKDKTAVEQALAQILEAQKAAAAKSATPPQPGAGDPGGLKAEDVEKILEARSARAAAESNLATFKKGLMEKFGDKAAEMLASEAAKLGLDVAAISKLAQSSPQAALRILGMEAQAARIQAIKGTVVHPPTDKGGSQPKVRPLRIGATDADLRQAWRNAGSEQ